MCSYKWKIWNISNKSFVLTPGSCPRGGTWVGGRRGKKNLFLVAYQIDGDDEQNRMQVKFSPAGQTGDLRVWSKGQISFTKSISKIFIPNFVFSQIKDINLIDRHFHSVSR